MTESDIPVDSGVVAYKLTRMSIEPRPVTPRTCKRCEAPFRPKKRNQLYCARACKVEYHNERLRRALDIVRQEDEKGA